MSEKTRRALRTLLQSTSAGTVVGGIVGFLSAFNVIHWSGEQVAAVVAVGTLLLTPVFTLIQNAFDDAGTTILVARDAPETS